MTTPNYSIVFSAQLVGTTVVSVGQVLIPSASVAGQYVVSTSANRGTRRSEGIALTDWSSATSPGSVQMQQSGTIEAAISGLAAGSASWVRCSTTGVIERCTPSGSDDIIGYAEADGRVHLIFGVLTAAIVNGGGGSVAGSDTQVIFNDAGAYAGDAGVTYNKTTDVLSVAGGVVVTGALGYVSIGTNPATAGGLLLPNELSHGSVRARNFANSANIELIWADTGNQVHVGDVVNATSTHIRALNAIEVYLGATNAITVSSSTFTIRLTSMQATGNARRKGYSDIANVQTTDATVTSLFTWTILDEAVTRMVAEVDGDKSDGSQTASYVRALRFKRDASTVTAGTIQDLCTDEEDATWDCTIDNSTSTGRVRVTGKAATTIDWGGTMTRWETSHA